MENNIPKIFISHASDDKERIVEKLAIKLRENGIDAWVSFWEILDGDSLIDKIFNEGIEQSNHFLIILSNFSINKPWVIKELNIAIIKQINENYNIIPIVLDNVKVPTALLDTKYRVINHHDRLETEFIAILNSIFRIYDKPPIGNPPKYVTHNELISSQISKIDNLVLKIICQTIIDENSYHIDVDTLKQKAAEIDLLFEDLAEAIRFLDNNNYVSAAFCGGPVPFTTVYPLEHSLMEYLFLSRSDTNKVMKSVLSFLNNHATTTVNEIADFLNEKTILIYYMCKYFENKGLCYTKDLTSEATLVMPESSSIKRYLNNN